MIIAMLQVASMQSLQFRVAVTEPPTVLRAAVIEPCISVLHSCQGYEVH